MAEIDSTGFLLAPVARGSGYDRFTRAARYLTAPGGAW